ncbi:hypothetical protein [Bacillus mesophilum]|nr:hypothetical protein [Bacillus mesophilum]
MKRGVTVEWFYLVLIVLTTGFGLWGLVSREKWLKKQADKVKDQ